VNDATKFLVWCGLTCMGGSERKQCECTHPQQCHMRAHPDFDAQRKVATERLCRCAVNEHNPQKETAS
jgi:hypothetical protein